MKRILTAAIGIPFALAVTLYSPHWLFALIVAVFAGICFNELITFTATRTGSRPGSWVAVAGAAVTAAFAGDAGWVLTILVAAFLFCCAAMIFEAPLSSMLPNIGLTALGLIYCCILLGFVIWLPGRAVIVLMGTIWVGDSAAFYGGRALGRHALAPTVSPNKTVEGSVAGLAGSVFAGTALGVWLLGRPISFLVPAVLAAAVAGQLGDLAESALKRSAEVKDSSALLPGHGGMLDRFDSLLFAAPVFYWFLHP
jgi:phosphatidate cytidylyltransferase